MPPQTIPFNQNNQTTGGGNPPATISFDQNTPAPTIAFKDAPTNTGLGAGFEAMKSSWNNGESQSINPLDWGKSIENAYNSSIDDALNKASASYNDFKQSFTDGSSVSRRLGDAGEFGLSVFNGIIAPLGAMFKGAESIPVVGYLAKGINSVLAGIGSGTGNVAIQGLNAMPISDEAKKNLTPIVNDTASLVGQVLAGKVGIEDIHPILDKFHNNVQTIFKTVKDESNVGTQVATDIAKETGQPIPKVTEAPVAPTEAPKATEAPVASTEVPKTTPSLDEQAKNYNSADEFVKAQQPDTSYQYGHQPNSDGVRAFDLTEKVNGDQMIPKDMYSQWYGSRGTPEDLQSISVLKKIKGNPEADVTIYRASPSKDFNSGDWVTLSKKYAEQHASSNAEAEKPMKVFSKTVKAKDVRWAMDDINEFGYFPEKQNSLTKSQLTDIWNKAQESKTKEPTTVPVRTAKSASDISQTMAEQGFKALPDEEQAKYSPTTVKEQIDNVAKVMDNIDEARSIIRGEKSLPHGVNDQVFFNAMEKYAIDNKDGALMSELSKSPLASKLSMQAQSMGLHGHTDNPNSPVTAIRDITKMREDKFLKQTGQTVEKARKVLASKEKANLKDEVTKSASKRESWESFIQNLTCKI